MQGNNDTLVLGSRTVLRKISDKINLSKEIKKLSPLNRHLLMDILYKKQPNEEPAKMATKEEMVDMLKKQKLQNPQKNTLRTCLNVRY